MSAAAQRPDPHQPAHPTVLVGGDADDAALVAVGYTREQDRFVVGDADAAALEALGVDAFELLDRAEAKGAGGSVVSHELLDPAGPVRSVALIGLGGQAVEDYRRAGAALSRLARRRGPAATGIGALADDDQLAGFVEGAVLGGFGFRVTSDPVGTGSSEAVTVTLTGIATAQKREPLVQAARARALASWRARTYSITPSNDKNPERLEGWAVDAAARAALDLEIWDDRRLAAEGFGGIVAVGSGSVHESRFLRLDYRPRRGARKARHIVLVGKGITFDTGGISIKPRAAMENMKRDMTGAAVVIAVMGALRELDVPVKVTGLVASAENAFGAASMRPGDVVTHYGGRTSEVGNTDAEGRLVLADALAYAAATIDADAVVDIATLTGAGKVALGTGTGALFANDDPLAAALYEAGRLAGEPVWRLPLSDEYESLLDTPFADAYNSDGNPGAVTAALFLQHFTGDAPWAHLDIASVGDSPNDAFEYTKGATGFGARLLLRWLATQA